MKLLEDWIAPYRRETDLYGSHVCNWISSNDPFWLEGHYFNRLVTNCFYLWFIHRRLNKENYDGASPTALLVSLYTLFGKRRKCSLFIY